MRYQCQEVRDWCQNCTLRDARNCPEQLGSELSTFDEAAQAEAVARVTAMLEARAAAPSVVAYVTRLGYLHCRRCVVDGATGGTPVHADSSPHAFELCDCCGKLP